MRRITAFLALAVLASCLWGCHHRYEVLRADDVQHSASLHIDDFENGVLYVTATCPTGMGNGALELKKGYRHVPGWPAKIVVQLEHSGKQQFTSLERFHARVQTAPGQFRELKTKQLVNPSNWIQVEIYLEPADRNIRVINLEWIASYRI
jgi:hypothetical protein